MNPNRKRHLQLHAFLYGVRSVDGDGKCLVKTTELPAPEKQPAEQEGDADAELISQLIQQNAVLLESVSESVQDLESARRQSLEELQQVAVELSIVVASHVIQKQINDDAGAIAALVRQAVDRLSGTEPVTIHVHPDDLVRLDAMWESSDVLRPENTRFVADHSLAIGSCFAASTDFGLLSALDARLAEIRQALLEGIEDAQTERRTANENSRTVRRFPDRRETA